MVFSAFSMRLEQVDEGVGPVFWTSMLQAGDPGHGDGGLLPVELGRAEHVRRR
jgi:hypothetical protein